jgi:hypothetical protein
MDTHVKGLLDQLATTCTKVSLCHDDWQKLYAVCLHVHWHGGVPDLRMIKAYLITKGCSKAKAGFLGRQFEHLTEILKLHDEHTRKVSGL